MTTRYDDQPTQEIDRRELDALIAQSERMGYAPDPYEAAPVVVDDPPPVVIGDDAPSAIEAIDAAAAEVSIDLPLDDSSEAAGFVAAPVDPRIAERRNEVQARNKRERRRRLLAIIAAPIVGAAAMLSLYSPLLDVDHINIIGSETLSMDELAKVGGLSLGDPMVMSNLSEVEDRLNADPRFRRVAVTRKWPNAINVRVTDRRAISALVGPSRSLVIGEGGIVMRESSPEDFIGQIQIETDIETEVGERLPDALAAAVEVLTRLPLSVGWNIAESLITAEGELIFTMADDAIVVFGTVEDAEAKIASVVTMLTSNVDRDGVCRIDVRVPASPTVRRAPNCELPPRPRDLAVIAAEEAKAAAEAAEIERRAAESESLSATQTPQAETSEATPSSEAADGVDAPPAGGAEAPNVPNDGGIIAPPPAAGRSDGTNREPGADGIQ